MTWFACDIRWYDLWYMIKTNRYDMIWFSSMVWQWYCVLKSLGPEFQSLPGSSCASCVSIWPRLPTHLEPEADINLYANASGFTSAIMKDLQRIFSCLAVDSGSDENRAYLRKVANGKGAFSSKVTLAMSSQSAWRRGWGCESWIGRSVIKLGFPPASVDLAAFFGHSRAASTLGPTVCRLVIHCLWP